MKACRRLILLMSILVIAGILAACAAPGSTVPAENSTTPYVSSTSPAETGNTATPIQTSPAAAGSPTGQASPIPVNTEFANMLSFVPFSFLKEHDIWFGNMEKAKEVYGIQDADSAAAIAQLPQEQARQILSTLGGIAIPFYASKNFTPEFTQFFGFDVWMANRIVLPQVCLHGHSLSMKGSTIRI